MEEMDVGANALNVIAGWVIDGTGGPIRRNVLMRIRKGAVASLRRARPGEIESEDVPLLDLSGCTVAPGLVDCHVHLTMSGTNDPKLREEQLDYAFARARPVVADHLRRHLLHGVAAVRDGGDSAAHTLRFKNECLPGENLPIHLKSAGKAWRAQGRYGRLIGRPPAAGFTLAECIARREERTDHVKIVNSGLNSLKEFGKETPPQFSPGEMEAAVRSARGKGLRIMVHANGGIAVRQSVDAGRRSIGHGFSMSIEHGFFMGRENIERMAELQTFWVPTAFSMEAYCAELEPGSIEAGIAAKNLDHQLEQLARARDAGVPIAVGTDSGGLGIHHGASFAREMGLLMKAGFSLEETIRCAAMNGARLLGLEDELGRLEPGMPATFIVFKGAPADAAQALGTPEQVYIRGSAVAL